jgi:hypothetical protein
MKKILYITLSVILFTWSSTALAAGNDPLVEKKKT